MQQVNAILLLILGMSPFAYMPFVIKEDRRKQNRLLWLIITFLVGLIQCMAYLLVLLGLGLSL